MKANKIIILLSALFVLSACKLKTVVNVNEYYAPVSHIDVYGYNQQLPNNIVRIGSIEVGEAGLTKTEDCSYEACLSAIKNEAKKNGAELVHIIHIKEPSSSSTCYHITAELYKYIDNQ